MFKIFDGRDSFYQWDLDRRLIVDSPTIKEVHFCNRTGDCSLVCETYAENGVMYADVPNILLQTAWRIRAYAYDGNATLHEESYDVIPRTKPADYVYTETEVLNFNLLLERINEVDANIEEIVEDYLHENPPTADLSNYYNIQETDNKFALKDEVPIIVGLATEEYVDEKVGAIKVPEVDLTGLATEQYVNDAISAIEIPDADMSDYYTKTEIDDMLANLPTGSDIPSGAEVKF